MLDCKATYNLVYRAETGTVMAVNWCLTTRVTFIATMISSFHGHRQGKEKCDLDLYDSIVHFRYDIFLYIYYQTPMQLQNLMQSVNPTAVQ